MLSTYKFILCISLYTWTIWYSHSHICVYCYMVREWYFTSVLLKICQMSVFKMSLCPYLLTYPSSVQVPVTLDFGAPNYDPVLCHYQLSVTRKPTCSPREVCPGCQWGSTGHLAPWCWAVGHYCGEQTYGVVWERETDRQTKWFTSSGQRHVWRDESSEVWAKVGSLIATRGHE